MLEKFLFLWRVDLNRVGNKLSRAGPPAILLGSSRKMGCRSDGIANGKRAGTRPAHVHGNGSLLCAQPVEDRLDPRLHLRGYDAQIVMNERICRLGIAGA